MDEVSEVVQMATNPGNNNLIVVVILLLVAIVFVAENVKKIIEIFGLKNKWSIHEEEQNVQIKVLKEELDAMKIELDEVRVVAKDREDKCTIFENSVSDILGGIKEDLLHSQVDEARYRILDFASAITKREYSKEYYDHVLEVYSKYEKILRDHGMTNGKAEMAIQYIKKRYAEYQQNGFPVY